MTKLATRLRYMKRKKRLSLSEIADCVGVSKQSVDAWMRGHTMPTAENLVRLAECLGVSEEWLREGESALGSEDAGADYMRMVMRIMILKPSRRAIIEMLLDDFEDR